MRNIWITILFFLLPISILAADDNTIDWKTYLSYYNTEWVEESADQVFVVAEGSLYSYGKEDNSIKQYYKGNGLNDTDIQFISYNKQTQSLLIVYTNSNIDILERNSVTNLPYLYNSTSIRNKTVNAVMLYNEYAYLSTEFGVMVVNMDKKEITNTYNLSLNVTSCAILNDHIYISTTDTPNVLFASLDDNLLDRTNWNDYVISDYPTESSIDKIVSFNNQLFYMTNNNGVYYESNNQIVSLIRNSQMNNIKIIGDKLACIASSQIYIFTDTQTFDQINNLSIEDISTYQTDQYWIAEGTNGLRSIRKTGTNQFEAVNEAITIDGPYTNSAFDIVCQNSKVYVIPGGKNVVTGRRIGLRGAIMIYDYNQWQTITSTDVQSTLNISPRDYTDIVISTNDAGEEIIYTSSFGDGIFEFRDGVPTIYYNARNSPLENAGNLSNYYCYMDGVTFDNDGNLWMTNSEVNNAIKILDKEGQWHSLSISSLNNKYTVNDILVTRNNDKWINVPQPNDQSCLTVIANSNSLDEVISYSFKSFTDTEGNDFTPNNFTCLTEDKNGYIWIGTNKGVIYITNPQQATSENYASTRCTRIIMTDEDESLYYFLDNVVVTTIKVDAGNRKWIGTNGNGVYVLSEDNQEIVHQFNTSNSPLLSDNIYDIDIDEKGEVFIGTDKGLVSYKGEAAAAQSNYSNVYAYPNPVRPEYRDKVTITGLMDNSIVKITDLSGNIIYQTKSLGGQVVWNCQNRSGSRVASGIYLVLSATENSKESVVTKIAVIK